MTNRELWEAFPALQRFGRTKMPASLAWRVVLNRNHLQPAWEALDETRRNFAIEMQISEEFAAKEGATPAFVLRLREFEEKWREMLAEEVAWVPAATIEAKLLNAVPEFVPDDIAPLVLAGIIVNPDGFLNGNGKE